MELEIKRVCLNLNKTLKTYLSQNKYLKKFEVICLILI